MQPNTGGAPGELPPPITPETRLFIENLQRTLAEQKRTLAQQTHENGQLVDELKDIRLERDAFRVRLSDEREGRARDKSVTERLEVENADLRREMGRLRGGGYRG